MNRIGQCFETGGLAPGGYEYTLESECPEDNLLSCESPHEAFNAGEEVEEFWKLFLKIRIFLSHLGWLVRFTQ